MNTLRILVLIALVLGCGTTKNTNTKDAIDTEPQQINQSVNQFGFDLFKQVSEPVKNTFFSPISISSAMAMAYLGAHGKTGEEFQQVLHFGTNSPVFHESMKKNMELLTSKDSINLLKIANSIWLQKDFTLKKDYTDGLKSYYSGNFFAVDFINDMNRSQVQNKINNWVADETNNKIKNIIPDNALTPRTRTVLVNAVYFLSEWEKPFNEERNTKRDFYSSGKKKVETVFMNNSQKIPYYEDDDVQCIDIPYKGGKYSLFVVLTKRKDSADWYKKSASSEYFQKIQDGFQSYEVDISIPKFKLETTYELIPYLQKMGMQEAFTEKADFSRMRDKNDLKITDVLHKAFVEVNEKGTEAAASTAVIMSLKAAYISEKKKFVADHPFMFMIMEKETNTVLFMGELSQVAI